MSPRSWIIRVNDMIKAIDDSAQIISGKTFSNFKADRTLVLASLACVQIVGEACKHVPDEVKSKYPKVPWSEIRGMRNRVTHEYFEVDESILWETVSSDFPGLKIELLKIIND